MKENLIISTKFNIELDRNMVLNMMDCYPDSPIYEETIEEYEEVKEEILKKVQPRCIIAYDDVLKEYEIPGTLDFGSKAFYVIVTIGKEASELSSKYFDEGDYLKGMLADTISDAYVFHMEGEIKDLMKIECEKRQIGISRRLEAPNDVPMDYQKIAYEMTGAKENLGMDITSGLMLDPLKSNCIVYSVTSNTEEFKVGHNCKTCSNIKCKMRKITDVDVTIYNSKGELTHNIVVNNDESMLEAMIKSNVHINAPCGGKGACGKCKIKVIEGVIIETEADKNFFTKEQISDGYRLACRTYPQMNCKIELDGSLENEFDVVGTDRINDTVSTNIVNKSSKEADDDMAIKNVEYSLAIDIGTTTIAIALIDNRYNKVVDIYTGINSQRCFGADVITRIDASNEGKGEELKVFIRNDLEKGISELINRCNINEADIYKVVISANTTMNHLLLGFSCKTLGVSPFTPVDISRMEMKANTILEGINLPNAIVTILPSISTFVGGDIVSGLIANNQGDSRCTLLVDLGTNGEIALANKGEILVTSTAMGPACEGGNITWGMGGIPGAISEVNISSDGEVRIDTIRGVNPIGICGTGVLETVAELLKNELVDETGLMDEEYFEEGFPLAKTDKGETIVFTQKDVREIQLAKAAVRAGVETLIKKANISYENIDKVYLAGGFGFKLNKEKAIEIGLFSDKLRDKIEAAGNTSLEGAIKYALAEPGEDELNKRLDKIIKSSIEVSLGADKIFNELYVENMMFEE